jgi:hypothetical protein
MIEHRALITANGLYLRERRGVPGLAAWQSRGFVASDALDQLDAWSARSTRLRLGLTVYLGTSLCRLVILQDAKGVKNLREYEAIASHALADRLGLTPANWIVRVDPGSALGVVACAVRRETIERVVAVAARLAQPLRSIQPWAARALANASRRVEGAGVPLVLHEPGSTLALATDALGNTRFVALPESEAATSTLGLLGIEGANIRHVHAVVERSGARRLDGEFRDLLAE